MDSRKKRDGDYIEKIGYYNPRTVPPTVEIDKEILKKWMDNGAQPTDTVYDILVREKVIAKADKLRAKRVKLMVERSKKLKEANAPKEEEVKPESPKTEEAPKPEKTTTTEEAPKTEEKVEPVKEFTEQPVEEVKKE